MLRKIVLTAMMVLAVPTMVWPARELLRGRAGTRGIPRTTIPAARQAGEFADHRPSDRPGRGNSKRPSPADRQARGIPRVTPRRTRRAG